MVEPLVQHSMTNNSKQPTPLDKERNKVVCNFRHKVVPSGTDHNCTPYNYSQFRYLHIFFLVLVPTSEANLFAVLITFNRVDGMEGP